jgi:Cu/Ag efflux protein CusF
MKKPALLLATALSTVALAGAIGVGVAAADPTPSPSPSATASPTPSATPTARPTKAGKPDKANKADKAKKGAKRNLASRALHGEVPLGGTKHRVVDFQRGTVSAVSASSITVTSTDDFTATYVVDATTEVRHAKAKAAIADVKTGDKVRVVASEDGATLTATKIADRTK